jgi:hypothetical protein
MIKVQLSKIKFELDSLDVIQQPNYQESLQETYVGRIYELDLNVNSNSITDELIEKTTEELQDLIENESGLCLDEIDFEYIFP